MNKRCAGEMCYHATVHPLRDNIAGPVPNEKMAEQERLQFTELDSQR